MGSVPSEYRREGAVSLDVQIGSECTYSAAVSTSVCLPYLVFQVLRQKAFICSGLFLCHCFQNTSDRYKSSSWKAGPGRGGGSKKHKELSKSCFFCGPVQQDICASAPSGIRCVRVPCCFRSYASEFLGPLSTEGGGSGGGLSSLPERK